MKKVLFIVIVLSLCIKPVIATEGMWIPLLLSQLNEAEMKSMGMKLNSEDIYAVNKGSLKDAIISFGGFCTGEIVSDQGLLLTNHHCGFDAIQSQSSMEHNYVENGFWAMNRGQELPNPGLFATFIIRIEDISAAALAGITNSMGEKERQLQIDKNLEEIKKNVTKETWQQVSIKPFFEGNQYFLFVTETYKDVRLVGTPPLAIGKFGSDTDNWVWPRHTGDFSVFRVYADKNNRPAEYSPDNQPYKPRHFLPISLDGVEEGDFTMVFGFPGRTTASIPSYAVSQLISTIDPSRIALRDKALKILDEGMRKDPTVKLKYVSKYARIANGWKKWIGELQGLKSKNVLAKKQDSEAEFQKRVLANPGWKKDYGSILDDFKKYYSDIDPFIKSKEYYQELFGNIELLGLTSKLSGLIKAFQNNGEAGYTKERDKILAGLPDLFKDLDASLDKQVCEALTQMYVEDLDDQYVSPDIIKLLQKNKNSYKALADKLYKKSALVNESALSKILSMTGKDAIAALQKDPLMIFADYIRNHYTTSTMPKLAEIQPEINRLQRLYMKAQMDVFKEKRFYPDANSTLRLTYGKTAPYYPKDGIKYEIYTYLEGIMEKYVPGDYEFDVPGRLLELYKNKDYGQYSVNGKVPVCFIGSNHTTGGNSGSPALDAYGNLIGLNFDRVWEGTMSDVNYDPSICRNIMVDTRYILFIIDKYAGATHLIEEMKLVHPKSK